MAKYLDSRFRGTCRGCGGDIPKGARILWTGKKSAYHAPACIPAGAPPDLCSLCGGGGVRDVRGETIPCHACRPDEYAALSKALRDRDEAQRLEREASRPLTRAELAVYAEAERRGATMHYTNPRGRCEDAPCCGCCS